MRGCHNTAAHGHHGRCKNHAWWSLYLELPCMMVIVSGAVMYDGHRIWSCHAWWSSYLELPCMMIIVSGAVVYDGHRIWSCHVWWSSYLELPCMMVIVSGAAMRDGHHIWSYHAWWSSYLELPCMVVIATYHALSSWPVAVSLHGRGWRLCAVVLTREAPCMVTMHLKVTMIVISTWSSSLSSLPLDGPMAWSTHGCYGVWSCMLWYLESSCVVAVVLGVTMHGWWCGIGEDSVARTAAAPCSV